MTAITGAPARRSITPQARYVALGMKLFNLNRRLDQIERDQMARVRWDGKEFPAEPISQNADGSWQMRAQQSSARTAPGTVITVKAAEIVPGTMPAAGDTAGSTTPAPVDNGQAALDAAMAEERKTIPTPAQIMAQSQTTQSDPGAVPPGPTPAPAAAPVITTAKQQAPQSGPSSSQGTKPMTHLADKMKLLAGGTTGFVAQLEKLVDQKLADHTAAQATVLSQVTEAFATVDAVTADAQAGANAIQAAMKDLTNQ